MAFLAVFFQPLPRAEDDKEADDHEREVVRGEGVVPNRMIADRRDAVDDDIGKVEERRKRGIDDGAHRVARKESARVFVAGKARLGGELHLRHPPDGGVDRVGKRERRKAVEDGGEGLLFCPRGGYCRRERDHAARQKRP